MTSATDLYDELARLEADTFEIQDVVEMTDAMVSVTWSSCSTSSCCGCSSSSCGSCCSTSCSCGSTSSCAR